MLEFPSYLWESRKTSLIGLLRFFFKHLNNEMWWKEMQKQMSFCLLNVSNTSEHNLSWYIFYFPFFSVCIFHELQLSYSKGISVSASPKFDRPRWQTSLNIKKHNAYGKLQATFLSLSTYCTTRGENNRQFHRQIHGDGNQDSRLKTNRAVQISSRFPVFCRLHL